MPWAEDYRPETIGQVAGNRDARKTLLSWANSWDMDSDAIVLYGVPGVGKTTTAHALASDMDWATVEMDASEKRTGDIVKEVAGEASKTRGLGGETHKLVIIDEADNLHGNIDRGGKRAMTKVIKEASQPIILIANDFYEMSRTLRNNCTSVEFEEPSLDEIVTVLKRVCTDRDIDTTESALTSIATAANGDVRGAVNGLQKAAVGRDQLDASDLQLTQRDKKQDIFPFLDELLKEEAPETIADRIYDVDMTPRELFRWLENNIFREYSGETLSHAYESLSQSNVWLGRTRKTQEYRYWRYASDNLGAGLAAARNSSRGGWTRWQPPRYSSSSKTRDMIAEKIASRVGCSASTAKTEVIPLLSVMTAYCKPREITVGMAAYYDLNEKQLAEITGSGKTTNKVESIVEDAQTKRQEFDIDAPASVQIADRDDQYQQSTEDTGQQQEDETQGLNASLSDAETDDADEDEADEDANRQDSTDDGDDTKNTDTGDDDNQTGIEDFI